MRFCLDARKLKARTTINRNSIMRPEAIFDKIGSARVLSSIDLRSAFLQVPLSERSRKLTAFHTDDGSVVQYTRMIFGLRNAPSVFGSLMTRILADLHQFCAAYLDDLIIWSDNLDRHLDHIQQLDSHSAVRART